MPWDACLTWGCWGFSQASQHLHKPQTQHVLLQGTNQQLEKALMAAQHEQTHPHPATSQANQGNLLWADVLSQLHNDEFSFIVFPMPVCVPGIWIGFLVH